MELSTSFEVGVLKVEGRGRMRLELVSNGELGRNGSIMYLVGWRPYFGTAVRERAVMGSWSDAVMQNLF